jgi:hypothetical protein
MRLLVAALGADKYRNIQFKGRPVWQKLFEPQLAMAEVAVLRWRRLDEVAHAISFRTILFVTRTGALKPIPVSNGATEHGGPFISGRLLGGLIASTITAGQAVAADSETTQIDLPSRHFCCRR